MGDEWTRALGTEVPQRGPGAVLVVIWRAKTPEAIGMSSQVRGCNPLESLDKSPHKPQSVRISAASISDMDCFPAAH